MTFFARVLGALVVAAGAAAAQVDAEDRARVEDLLSQGAFERADSLATVLYEAAPESSETRVDALLLVVRAAGRSGSIPLTNLVRVAEHLIALQTAVLPEDDPRIADAWHELGSIHVRRGRQDDAAIAYREAHARRRATLGDDATPTIRSALGLANALQWTGETDAARELFREQIARLEARPEGRENRLVYAWNGLGFLLDRTGDREGAIEAWRGALRIATASLPELDRTRALVERNLGTALAETEPEIAVEHLQRALAIRRAVLHERDVLIGKVAARLASVEARLGRTTSAEEHFALAIDVLRGRSREGDTVRAAWIGRANAAIETGAFDAATTAIDSAAASGVTGTTVLALRANRANAMGDFEVAVDLYDRALRRREAETGRASAEVARLLHNRAEILSRLGRVAAALDSRREAVGIQVAVLEDDDPDLALGRLNLAVGLLENDRPDEVLALLDDVEPSLASALGDGHPARANLLLLRARALLQTSGAESAVAPAEAAVARRRQAYGEGHVEVAWALDELAGVLIEADALDRAAEVAAEADRIGRRTLRDVVSTLPERQALAFVGEGRTGRDRLLEIARRDPTDARVRIAFDATVRGRSLVLDTLLERRRASASTDTAVTAAREAFTRARRDLVVAATRGEADPERWTRLRTRRERAEARLAKVSRSSVAPRIDRGLDHVVHAIEAGEALVSFVVRADDDRVDAFVVRDRSVARVDVGSASALDDAVAVWLEAMRGPIHRVDDDPDLLIDEARVAARALGEILWDPLAPELEGIERIWWVPDGALHRVQPAALVDREGAYLAQRDVVFAHLGAERDLDPALDGTGGGLVLAIGDPDFGPADGSSPPCPDLATLRFAPLPATRVEVTALANATIVTGADAREESLARRVEGHETLHLATHGFFLPARCEAGANAAPLRGLRGIGGVVKRGGRRTAADGPGVGPLLRSGLALAGANLRAGDDPSRDGILLAEEIAGYDLGSIRTVVLSACDTGVGRIVAGEGVLGLPRAFRRAGARQVVMSLWPVQDDATRAWMQAFYRARNEGSDVAVAAHAARRATLARDGTRHPFFWAAFVTIGPGR